MPVYILFRVFKLYVAFDMLLTLKLPSQSLPSLPSRPSRARRFPLSVGVACDDGGSKQECSSEAPRGDA